MTLGTLFQRPNSGFVYLDLLLKSKENCILLPIQWEFRAGHCFTYCIRCLLVSFQPPLILFTSIRVFTFSYSPTCTLHYHFQYICCSKSECTSRLQGSLAKKPFNPVIGETFHCSWPVSSVVSTGSSGEQSSAANNSRLVYTAEQVSHHPPVTAFYFECPEKQVYLNASIYTKSKFMGMSIGVSMLGNCEFSLF